MKTMLEKMTLEEYDIFYEWSFKNHIRELKKENSISEEDAISETKQELLGMLPNGIETKIFFM